MKDGAILSNTGHFNVEIDIPALEALTAERAADAPERGALHAQRRPHDLPDRRGPAGQPGRRRGTPGRRHGHVVRQPGALGGVRADQPGHARASTSTTCRTTSIRRSRASSWRRSASTSTPSAPSRSATSRAGTRAPDPRPARSRARAVLAPADVIRLEGDAVVLLDQTRLPGERVDRRCTTRAGALRWRSTSSPIRGAPAIGDRGGHGDGAGGAQLGRRRTRRRCAPSSPSARAALAASRPTAVNLALGARALRRGHRGGRADAGRAARRRSRALARRIHEDEVARCRAMGAPRRRAARSRAPGAHALQRRRARHRRLRHRRSASCARRTRATGRSHVWVDETRPLLQGARLTAWELAQDGIPHTLIADVAAGQLFARGARRRASSSAPTASPATATPPTRSAPTRSRCSRARHGVPVLRRRAVLDDRPRHRRAARRSRSRSARADEVARLAGRALAPEGTAVSNPAFDVTPAANITAIVTEAGVHRAPFEQSLPVSAR